MDSTMVMVVAGLVAAVVGGFFVSRASEKIQPIRGGPVARTCHYLACAAASGIPAALLVMIVWTVFTPDNLVEPFVKYALVSLAVSVVALLLYGVVEPETPEPEMHALPPLD